jgi:predicted nucleic acid-binding protein
MAGLYLDTSSLGRVLLAEPDAAAIRDFIGGYEESWSSALIVIELRRLARREGLTAAADRMLASMHLHPITGPAIERASRLDPVEVRTLDAIHLDAAIDLHGAGTITTVLTHDEQLRNACAHHGIPLAAPNP